MEDPVELCFHRAPMRLITDMVKEKSGRITTYEVVAEFAKRGSSANRRQVSMWVSRLVTLGYLRYGDRCRRDVAGDGGQGGPRNEILFVKDFKPQSQRHLDQIVEDWKACGLKSMSTADFKTLANPERVPSAKSRILTMRNNSLLRICWYGKGGRATYELGDPKDDAPIGTREPRPPKQPKPERVKRASAAAPKPKAVKPAPPPEGADDEAPEDYRQDVKRWPRSVKDKKGVYGVDGLPAINSVFALGAAMNP